MRSRAGKISPNFTPIVYGDRATIMATSRALDISLQIVDPSANAPWPALRVVEIGPARETIALGSVSAEAGRLAYIAVERAVADAIDRRIDAIVTGPISKEAINLAGHAYAGHTEMLADLTESADTCMMLTHGNLRVSHVSTHVALPRVPCAGHAGAAVPGDRAHPGGAHHLRHRRSRGSASPRSTRMPAKAASSVTRTPR